MQTPVPVRAIVRFVQRRPRFAARRRLGRGCAAAALGAGALLVWAAGFGRPGPAAPHPSPAAAEHPAAQALVGLWRLEPRGPTGSPVHFYYFHTGGKGLYRYGVEGLTQTRSFDYEFDGDRLRLRHRKTGRIFDVRVRVEGRGSGARLVLAPDPFGKAPRRVYVREADAGPRSVRAGEAAGGGVAGRMWIDLTRYETGGMGFSFYQFGPKRIDGRGVGWYHEGDFDDWTTEAFTFREREGALDLHFPVRDEHATTAFSIDRDGGERRLHLARDPRDFHAPHGYADAGPSFGAAGAGALLPSGRLPAAP